MRALLHVFITAPGAFLLTGCLVPVMMAPAMLPAMMPSLGLMTATTAATTAGNAALKPGNGAGGLALPSIGPKPAGVRQKATPRQHQVALSRARAAEATLKKSGAAKLPDYLAVETVSAPRNPPDTVQIMVYDTVNRSIASDEIYHFRQAPKMGAKHTVGPFRAQYCGNGTGA
jgi:hypothetical protein